jgi:hypothetical protein
MVEIPLPKIDDAKVTAIAQSDKWTAISRVASIFAAGVTTLLLAPLVIWGFATIQSSAIVLERHSGDIANAQSTLNEIKAEVGPDHDAITTLKSQMEGVINYIWRAPKPQEKKPSP